MKKIEQMCVYVWHYPKSNGVAVAEQYIDTYEFIRSVELMYKCFVSIFQYLISIFIRTFRYFCIIGREAVYTAEICRHPMMICIHVYSLHWFPHHHLFPGAAETGIVRLLHYHSTSGRRTVRTE